MCIFTTPAILLVLQTATLTATACELNFDIGMSNVTHTSSGHCAHDVGSDYGVSYSFVRSWECARGFQRCSIQDVCEAGCSPMNMDWSCCTYSSPCAVGEGDCDYDSDCM